MQQIFRDQSCLLSEILQNEGILFFKQTRDKINREWELL